MKLRLLLTLSLYTTSVFSVFAAPLQCTDAEKKNNAANNSVILLSDFNGPVKSIVMTSTIPDDGRFKALQGELQFDKCGNILKDSTSMQEYLEGRIETNLIRTSPKNPYVFKYQYQIKTPQSTFSIYMQETYSKDEQNRLNKKITQYYMDNGELMGTFMSRYTYKEGLIASEVSTSLAPEKEVITTQYTYNEQGKLIQVQEDDKINFEVQYDETGKPLKQVNYTKGIYDEDKTFTLTCQEWDKFNNCTKELFEGTIKFGDKVINYSKATLHNKIEYYE